METLAAHGRMGARSPQRGSYSILSSQPTPPPPHPIHLPEKALVGEGAEGKEEEEERPQEEEATRATAKEER